MNRLWRPFASGVLFCLATLTIANASELDLGWYTIDCGGDMWCVGQGYTGEIELSGTVGQPDASVVVMTGDEIELVGGFWPAGVEEAFCFGDLNGDNVVNLADLAQLLANYGTASGATYEDGDLDGDGDVDLADLAALLAVYGTTCP
jgi:hypothetical protein